MNASLQSRETLRPKFMFLALMFAASWQLPVLSDPLQGRVEDMEAGKSLNDALEARMDQFDKTPGLTGNVQSGGSPLQGAVQGGGYGPMQAGVQGSGNPLQAGVQGGGFNPLQGNANAGPPTMLNGGVVDPDGGDAELQIDWDRWRNTLTQAIQAGTINKINIHNDANFVYDPRRNMMMSRYPQGISTQYSIDVLPDLRIVNIRMMMSSGFPSYDQAVMQSIMDLQGNPLLRYPHGSHRQIVNQQASVISSSESRFQNFKFGDVERQRH